MSTKKDDMLMDDALMDADKIFSALQDLLAPPPLLDDLLLQLPELEEEPLLPELEDPLPSLEDPLPPPPPLKSSQPQPTASKRKPGQRRKMEPHAALFVNLFSYMESADYDAAVDEIDNLNSFTYSPEIDNCLKKISVSIQSFNYEAAKAEVTRLRSFFAPNVASNTKLKKIFAIDDMPDVLNTLKNLLKNSYSVYCATNHSAALKFLANNTPDLIFIDIEMPDMNGFALLKLIRKMDNCKSVPVIFLTGNVSVESVKASVDAGGNDFIRKPIDVAVLQRKIQKYL